MSDTLTCSTCNGTGQYLYSSSTMNMGPGGQVMTTGPCPGTRRRPDETDCPFVLTEDRRL